MYLEKISLQRKMSYVVGVKYPECWESWFSFGKCFRVKFSRKTFRLAPVDGICFDNPVSLKMRYTRHVLSKIYASLRLLLKVHIESKRCGYGRADGCCFRPVCRTPAQLRELVTRTGYGSFAECVSHRVRTLILQGDPGTG